MNFRRANLLLAALAGLALFVITYLHSIVVGLP